MHKMYLKCYVNYCKIYINIFHINQIYNDEMKKTKNVILYKNKKRNSLDNLK